jgi:hypothetical protein
VSTIDITIPEPGASGKSAQPSASNPEGRALLEKVRNFFGGAAAIGGINAIRVVADLSMNTPQGAMSGVATTLIQYPGSMRQDLAVSMGTISTVVTPETGFMVTPGGTQDLPSSRREAMVADMKTDHMYILRNADNPRYTFAAGGTEKIGDVEARVLTISADGAPVTWYVDPATGRLLRIVRTRSGAGGPEETVTDYSEWKKFGGVNAPTVATFSRSGEPAGELRVTAVEVNPAVDANAFTKP